MKSELINEYLSLAITAARHAGEEIMKIYTDPSQDFGIEKKADNSPLTLADKAAHACIASYLEQTKIPVLSEEGVHLPYSERKQWDTLWIVDPLDGTKEFIKKNGEFTVNIALVEDGCPILGVILVPASNILYYGIVGYGAYKQIADSEPLAMPLSDVHEGYVIVASRSHMSPETEAFVQDAKTLHSDVRLISSGSSIKICMVAEGTADAYPRYAPTMEWDTAAGDAIARAAGKRVIDADTNELMRYNRENLRNSWFLVE